ncbi:uncharacterized protein METZ01_LOCUS376872, partial [marine metagenome]
PVWQKHPEASECAARTSFIPLKANYSRVEMCVT